MKNLFNFFLIIFLLIMCTACPMDREYPIEIQIECNSPHNIGYLFLDVRNVSRTIPEFDKPPSIVEANTLEEYHDRALKGGGWSNYVKKYPNDTFSVFIFHPDTLNKYPWDQIRKEYKVLVRYDIAADDYYKFPEARSPEIKITIPYPPTDAMRTVHMCPSYDKVIEQYLSDLNSITGN